MTELAERKPQFGAEDILLEDALVALATLHEQAERFDTAREELEFFRDCLLGKRAHRTETEVIYQRKVREAS